MEQQQIGEGVLTWRATERRSDRYGSVYLIPEGANSFSRTPSPSLVNPAMTAKFDGRKGELIAVVTANRESTHIGDLFRGFAPSKPEIGEIINLGKGVLFTETAPEGGITVGLRPDDSRDHDWLNIKSLYRAHEQSVKLYFHPVQA